MRASKLAALLGLALAAAACSSACTVAAGIDVCDRQAAPERNVNATSDGDKRAAPGAVVELPGSGALVFFASVESDGSTDLRTVVRSSLISADGAVSRACARVVGLDVAYAASGGFVYLGSPTAGAPEVAGPSSLGLLTLVRTVFDPAGEIIESRLVGHNFDGEGCPQAPSDGTDPEFDIGDEGTGQRVIGDPSVVRIGANRFVVAWVSGDVSPVALRTRARARIVELRSRLAPVLGPIVEIDSGIVLTLAMTRLGEGRLAFAWQRLLLPSAYTFLEIWSDDLERAPGIERQLLAELESATMLLEDTRIALGFDGGQLLAAWTARDAGQPSRVFARFRGPSGEPFVSVDSLDGRAFSPSDRGARQERNPRITTLPEGGFLLAWEESGMTSAGSPTDTVRARAFDADGARRFLNGSCGTAPIDLSTRSDRSISELGLAVLGDDAVVTTWNASDRVSTLSEVRARALRMPNLLPIE